MINTVALRPHVSYILENACAQDKFLAIARGVSGIDNGTNVYLSDDPDSGYTHWQLEYGDGYNAVTEPRMNMAIGTSAYYVSIRHAHSGSFSTHYKDPRMSRLTRTFYMILGACRASSGCYLGPRT